MKLNSLALSFLLAGFLLPINGFAQSDAAKWNDEKTKHLDNFLQTCFEQKQFNGAVLLAEDGKVVYEKYLGYANPESKSKLSANSSFRLASVSKQFTAMGILMLMEQGKLELDDSIAKHLPGFPFKDVTVRQLIHHTGGLADYTNWFARNWDIENEYDAKKTAFNKDVVEQFTKSQPKPEFEPGEKFSYSNTGYVLLGQIIENVSEKPIRQFFQEEIFTPLKMTDTQAFSPFDDFTVQDRVYGFAYWADGISFEANDWNFLNGMIGDGGIYATARDLFKWDQALYGEQLVSQETMNIAFTAGKRNDGKDIGYGFGWMVNRNPDGTLKSVNHSGGWVGFSTYIGRNVESKRTIIVLTNDSTNHFNALLEAIANIGKGEFEDLDVPRHNIGVALAAKIEAEGIDAAVDHYYEIKKTSRKKYMISEVYLSAVAKIYFDKEQYDVAAKLYELGTKSNSRSSRAHKGLGLSRIKHGLESLRRASELKPRDEELRDWLDQVEPNKINK